MRWDDPLVRRFLARSHVMRLATMSAKGRPSLTPIWYVVWRGRLIASTAASSVAARNVRSDPRVTVLLDGEKEGRTDDLVRLRGAAEVYLRLPPFGVLWRVALKYYLSWGGLRSELGHATRWPLRARYYRQAQPAYIAITPISAELVLVPRERHGAVPRRGQR